MIALVSQMLSKSSHESQLMANDSRNAAFGVSQTAAVQSNPHLAHEHLAHESLAHESLAHENVGESAIEKSSLIESVEEIISQFIEPQRICGSVSIVNADEGLLLDTGLLVARWAAKEFGLQVGWCTKADGRFHKVARRNHFGNFDVDLVPISANVTHQHRFGFLVVDQLDQFTTDELQQLDEIVDAQIVLGLSNNPISVELNECFDQNLEVSWEWSNAMAY